MSGRNYNNKNMKPGESAPRHPNTNNYQQNNSRATGGHYQMTSNPKPMHNSMPNSQQHLPNHHHNIHNPQLNPLNNVTGNQPPFQQQIRGPVIQRPTSNQTRFQNRSNNQQFSYVVPQGFDPNIPPYMAGFAPYQVMNPNAYMFQQQALAYGAYPAPSQLIQHMHNQPGHQISHIQPQPRIQTGGPPAQPPTSIPNDVIPQPIPIDPKIPSSQPQTQISHAPIQSNRKKKVAILQDPTTLQEKDLNEIAKLPIDQTANQNANQNVSNQQITVTNQVVVLENHNEQSQNKPVDEQPNQAAISDDKKIEQTQSNRNQIPQQQQMSKQDTPVVEQKDKINTDDKLEVKKAEHKQPLLQNPDKVAIDVNNREIDEKIDVNKEPTKAPMINLEDKLDKLKIHDQPVKQQQDDEQLEKPVINKPAVNNKQEEAKEPESKIEKPVIDDKLNSVPSKKPEEPLDRPAQQNVQNVPKAQVNVPVASNRQESQVKQDVPAVKPQQPQQSSDAKKSTQVKGQSKSTEIISYDAEFLKKLQYSSFSIEKPKFTNLTGKIEIVLNEPRRQDESSDFEPQYLKMNSNRNSLSHGHRSMQMGPRMNNNNQDPNKPPPRKIITSSSLSKDVVLNTAKYSWKAANKEKKNMTNWQETTEGLISFSRGMLNKLTPQNFDKLSQGFLELGIDTEEKLKRMIELIFDKAVDEPAFCDLYAKLCKKMSTISVDVQGPNNEKKKIKFNTLLLERCQTCFETDKYKDLDLEKRLKEIDECEDKEKKKQLIDDLDEDKRLVRKKSLGNIKLIGALYKHDRLRDEIMNLCIETLINDNVEDSLECLCSLLKEIGGKYEASIQSNHKKSQFNSQMNKLEAIVKENKIASRIKFLIMDVLDMRKDNWKVRKLQEGNKPKKIDEVHEDIKKEEEQCSIQYSQLSKRNDSMKKRNDNWMNSGSRKSQQSSNDALNNLRKLNEQRNTFTPNLGPGGPTFGLGMGMSSWSHGASGAKTSIASTSQDKKLNHWQQRNPINDRSQQASPAVKARQFRGNYKLEEDNFDFISQLSDFLKAYIKSNSIDKLVDSIYDNCTEECVHLFVVAAIDCACESLLKNIEQIGEVLANLVIVKRVISYSQFHKGLKHHLDQSEDIVTDVPKFHEYIGQILSHFFNKLSDNDRRPFLKEALQPCIELNTSLLMVIHMIKHLIRDDVCQDISEPAKKWVASNLDWNDFLKENSEQFLKDSLKKYDLSAFVAELNNCKLMTNKSVETSNLVQQVLTSNFDEVPKIIEKNISPNDKELSKRLISAFVERCILDSTDFDNPTKSCDKNYTFNEMKFETKIKSIPIDIFNDDEYQLEVIYSACKVDHEKSNPKDLLFNIFNYLLNELNVVKKDTFIKWYKENKKERVGNGIAIMNMKRFVDNLIKQTGNVD